MPLTLQQAQPEYDSIGNIMPQTQDSDTENQLLVFIQHSALYLPSGF